MYRNRTQFEKCHFKVKVFTFCVDVEPLKKFPKKLAKCRRDAITVKFCICIFFRLQFLARITL